ncbi:hypothetical protein AB0M39_22685 [Streptomyces sp. NPDC051907]|uniref:hypothetical protein n=1 Tax=Streptomyces sp. NPDC051907 TaxID=3155284 RepID=UPI00343EBB50
MSTTLLAGTDSAAAPGAGGGPRREGALPVRCRRFAQAMTGAPRGARRDLTLSGRHRTVHLVEQGVRPGILGIDWDWE